MGRVSSLIGSILHQRETYVLGANLNCSESAAGTNSKDRGARYRRDQHRTKKWEIVEIVNAF